MPKDYLKEAYDIFDGRRLKPRKDHINALVNRLHLMSTKAHQLALDLQKAILDAEERKRNELAQKNMDTDQKQFPGGN
jgi:hypothetical protein